MKKVLVSISAVIGVILLIIAYNYLIRTFSVSDSGSNSAGDCAKYRFLTENEVISEVREIDFDFLIYTRFGWVFKSVKEGNCIFVFERYTGGSYFEYADIYDITVDKNLKISYTVKRAKKLNALSHYMEGGNYDISVSYDKDGKTKTFSADETESFNNEIDKLYGINADCEKPDLSGMTKITVEYKYLADYENTAVMYINGGEIYYPYRYDNIEYWAKFSLDDFCSLDGINALLEKD